MPHGIPFIILASAFFVLGPVLALLARRNWSRPVLWIAAGCLVSIVGDFFGRIAAHRVGNNYWVSTIDEPAMFTCFLVALNHWQVTFVERLAFRIAIFIFLIVYVLLVWQVEDVSTFSHYAVPMYTAALFAGATWTFQRRAFLPTARPLIQRDWAWVTAGFALYGLTRLISEPIAAALLAGHRLDLFVRVWEYRAASAGFVFTALTVGALLPPSVAEPVS